MITLSETWLDDSICDTEVSLPGYSLLRRDRNRHGGGVAIFISASIKFLHRPDLQSAAIENMWIELFPNGKRSILICCAYHPPSQSDFFNELLTGCDLALSTSKRIVILCDLNCNLLIPSLPNVKSLTSFCRQLKLTELVCAPTRITESSVSQLDVILTNTPDPEEVGHCMLPYKRDQILELVNKSLLVAVLQLTEVDPSLIPEQN